MSNAVSSIEQDADRAASMGDVAGAARLLEQATESDPGRFMLWTKLSAMRRASGDLPGALAATDRGLALQPLDFSLLLARAMLLDRLGDARAGEAFGHAVAQAPEESEMPPAMRPVFQRAKDRAASHADALTVGLMAEIGEAASPEQRERLTRFVTNHARTTQVFHQEPSHFHFPGLPEREFHDRADFQFLDKLEAATATIRDEFRTLLEAEAAAMVPYIQYPDRVPLRQWEALNHNRDWSALHLIQNGRTIDRNARHCPTTMALLAALPQPDVPGASPNAMFSMLAPRTRIPAHTGVANTRLVCHLPLIVPPHCGFRVGATTREWRPGEAFVFDDTIEHEAWNDSDELRVVMILDLWPPTLGPAERDAVARIIARAGVGFAGL